MTIMCFPEDFPMVKHKEIARKTHPIPTLEEGVAFLSTSKINIMTFFLEIPYSLISDNIILGKIQSGQSSQTSQSS